MKLYLLLKFKLFFFIKSFLITTVAIVKKYPDNNSLKILPEGFRYLKIFFLITLSLSSINDTLL